MYKNNRAYEREQIIFLKRRKVQKINFTNEQGLIKYERLVNIIGCTNLKYIGTRGA